MTAPAIQPKSWEIPFINGARRSNPDSGLDLIPDVFQFVAQTGVALGATITSAAVTIAGITTPTSVSVANGSWRKNGAGSFTSNPGTASNNDTIEVRHTASASNSTAVQTVLTVGGVVGVFTSTTISAVGARTGIIYRANFDTFPANFTNPEQSDLPSARNGTTDGFGLDHLGEANWSASAPVRALEHLAIVSSNPKPIEGGRCARATIYPQSYSPTVDYRSGGFQSTDKPRVDFSMASACKNIPLAFKTTYWMGIAIWLPSTYVEEDGPHKWSEILIQCHTNLKNNWDLEINGKSGGGAEWACDFNKAPPNSINPLEHSNPDVVFDLRTEHAAAWNVHIIQFNIDNRAVSDGGTPIFKWWHGTYNQNTLAPEIPMTLKHDVSEPYGYDAVTMPDGPYFSLNLYKPGWHGAVSGSGPYDGNKTSPIVMAFDAFRLGDATSDFASVHPLQAAQPF